MKTKRLVSVLVVLCMILSSMATVAFADEGTYTCTNVSFGYVSGDEWTDAEGLEAGKTLNAKISVSKTGAEESVVFSLIVYNNDKIFGVNTVTKSVGSVPSVLTAKAQLPDDVENCYVSAFLWDNYVDMNPICNISGFPDASVAVTSISVNGAVLTDFDPGVKTYEVPVDDNESIMPLVEVKTLDLGAKVTISNPTRFPGSSVIKVTNGSGDENVYTINYTIAKGLVYDIDYSEDAHKKVSGMVIPTLSRNFQVGSKAYYDREFKVTEILDESYLGLDYIGVGIGWKNSPPYREYYAKTTEDWWQFRAGRNATLKIVAQKTSDAIKALGFEETVASNFINVDVNGSAYKYGTILSKTIKKGELVKLPAFFDTNGYFVFFEFEGYKESLVPGAELTGIEISSMPDKLTYKLGDEIDLTGLKVEAVHSNGVKVEISDYEVSEYDMVLGTNTITLNYCGFTTTFDVIAEELKFGLASLSVDGTPVADFNIADYEYDVVIPASQAKFPVVEAVGTEGACVTVAEPTEFPGKAVVTVTKEGEETSEYTLNYVLEKDIVTTPTVFEDNTIPEAYGGGAVVAKAKLRKGGFTVGTPAYADREDRVEGGARYSVLEINEPKLIGADYITGCVTWYNGKTPSVTAFTSDDDLDWIQFTVNRDSTVYVLKHTTIGEDKLLGRGFTKSVSDNPHGYMYTLLNGENHRYHKYMYSRKVAAGTKVVIPNTQDNNNVFHTVITYDSYEELKPVVTLTGIELTKPEKLSYFEGDELDLTGLGVKAIYSDGTSENVTDYEVSSCDMSVGTHTLTVTYEGFSKTFDITVEEVPVEVYGLTSVTIDGKAVADFDTLTEEYDVVIPASQENFPVIDAVATEGATYEVTNPTEFPGFATVTVSKEGKEDVVYTFNYIINEAFVTIPTVFADNKIPETYGGGNVSAKPKYRQGGFTVGTPAYADREDRVEGGARYSILEINEPSLVGADYITGGITWYNGKTPTVTAFTSADNLDWLQFTVNRDATVYVLKHTTIGEEKLIDRGYTKATSSNEHGYMMTLLNGSEYRYHKYMYYMNVEAGTKVVVPNVQDTNNTYHTVIKYNLNYAELAPEEPDVPQVTLTGIEVAANPVKTTYIAGEQLDLAGLVVKALYSDNTSEVIENYNVSSCDMTEGTHTVIVSFKGYTASFEITVEAAPVQEAELVYDIAYVPEVLSNLNPANGKTALPYLNTNLQVNSPAYFCRDGVNDTRTSFITEVGEQSYLGLSYMGVGIAWKNSPPFRDYYATNPDQWFKFTVGKNVKITLLTTAKVDSFETALGFTYAAKANALKTVINNTTNYTFGHTYTKTFSAGDTIVFPSFFNSNALIILFDENVTE